MSDTTDDQGRISDATPDDGNPEVGTTGQQSTTDPTDTPEVADDTDTEAETETEETEAETETFSRAYVEQLRNENGKYRQRARKADEYAERLHSELVRATGRLADPTDLPFSEDHLTDVDSMAAALDALLQKKPHLANRRPAGQIGQGISPSAANVDLAAILRRQTT